MTMLKASHNPERKDTFCGQSRAHSDVDGPVRDPTSVRTFTTIASRYKIGHIASSGRDCHRMREKRCCREREGPDWWSSGYAGWGWWVVVQWLANSVGVSPWWAECGRLML